MTKAVYDTNILISGTFWQGIPRQIIERARQGQVEVITSPELLVELNDLLTRPGKSFQLSAASADGIVKRMQTFMQSITPTSQVDACRDPKDNMVLACALDGQADYLVTGDLDLLTLGEYEGVKIVTARQFVEVLDAESSVA